MLRPLILSCCLLSATAMAAEEPSILSMAGDRYEAGASVRFDGPTVADLFMAGNRVMVAAPVAGSAHLAGRRVAVDAAVAGDLFAAGYSVAVSGAVGGDVSVTGYVVSLGPVAGNVRVSGAEVTLAGVAGYALVAAAEITLDGAIAGDAVLAGDIIGFGPGASVGGQLTIYADDPASVTVPESVAPAARVRIEPQDAAAAAGWAGRMPLRLSVWRIAAGFLMGVLVSGLIVAMVIAVAPQSVQGWRTLALAHPGRAIWSGFLVTSALAGSGFVLMLTIVGAVLLPVMLVVTAFAILAGYALGSYVLGVRLWIALGRWMPDGLLGKFGLACLGAFLAGLAWAVPVAGWIFVLGLTLLGIGTLAAFAVPRGWLLRQEAAAA